jgi:hypothetical protein
MAVNTRHLGRHHVVEVSFVRIRTRSENQELTGHFRHGDSIQNLDTEKQRKGGEIKDSCLLPRS